MLSSNSADLARLLAGVCTHVTLDALFELISSQMLAHTPEAASHPACHTALHGLPPLVTALKRIEVTAWNSTLLSPNLCSASKPVAEERTDVPAANMNCNPALQ